MEQSAHPVGSSNSAYCAHTPYISAVISSRNDDHGGDMYGRMRTCFLGFIAQAERHQVSSELIIVDWNPPPDRPLLKDIFSWPATTRYCTVRSIVVPPEVHRQYAFAEAKALHATEAQNAGIRRARGAFILAGTADLLYADAFFELLAAGKLEEDRFFRADRIDIDSSVTQLGNFREQLGHAEKHRLRVFTEYGVMDLSSRASQLPHSRIGVRKFCPGARSPLPLLHTNAPDLFMMSRAFFERVHGWPDVGITGIHADGLLCYMAVAAGAAQVILPPAMDVYHIDHRSDWQIRPSPLQSLLRKYRPRNEFLRRTASLLYWRLRTSEDAVSAAGIPYMGGRRYRKICKEVYGGRRAYTWNDDSWGLRDHRLEDYTIVRASLEQGDVVSEMAASES